MCNIICFVAEQHEFDYLRRHYNNLLYDIDLNTVNIIIMGIVGTAFIIIHTVFRLIIKLQFHSDTDIDPINYQNCIMINIKT